MKHPLRKTGIAIICLLISITAGFTDQFHDQADEFWNRAMASKRDKNYKDAIDYLGKAVIAERKSGNVRNAEYLAQLKELGGLYVLTGDTERAEKCFGLIIDFAGTISDQASEAEALFALGRMYQEKKDPERALKSYGDALSIEEKLNRPDREMAALNGIAGVYRDRGEFDRSAEYYDRALDKMGPGGLDENRAALLNNLGISRFFSGNYRGALTCFTQARDIDNKTPLKKNLSSDYSNMATAYHVMGKLNEAIGLYSQALDIDRKNNGEKAAARLLRLAEAYHQKKEYGKALALCDESLKSMDESGNVKNRGYVFSQIGKTYDAIGQYDRALENFLKAAETEGGEDAQAAASRLSDIGMFYESRGMYDQAYNYFSIALTSGKEAAGKMTRAENLRNAGRVLLYMKRQADARKYLVMAADLDKSIGNREGLARDYDYLGRGSYMAEQYREAADTFAMALEIIEQVSGWEKESGETEREIRSWLIASMVRAGNKENSLAVILKKSRRECSPYLENERLGAFKPGGPGTVIALPGGSALVVFTNVAWDEPLVLVKNESGIAELAIDKKGMVKHFFSTYGNEINAFSTGMTSALNIIKGTSLHNYHYDFQRILFFYQSLMMKKEMTLADQKLIGDFGRDLHRFLFRDIESRLSGTKKIYVLAEDALRSFPFETLVRADGIYLAEKYVFQHQYLGFPDIARTGTSREGVVSIWADKAEPVARAEAVIDTQRYRDFIKTEVLGKIRKGKSLREEGEYFGLYEKTEIPYALAERSVLDLAASGSKNISMNAGEEKLKSFLGGSSPGARALHLGCVWGSDTLVNSLSSLLFRASDKKNDGLVNLRELSALNLNADFASVSSAEKAMMNPGESAGLISASLMSAGCGGVAVPLWPVEDRGHALFLKRLYVLLAQKGIDPAEAVARVRRSFIARTVYPGEDVGLYRDRREYDEEMNKFSNPYYWAPYIYYGR